MTMTDDVLEADSYVLQRTEAEMARLRAQSKALEPLTLRVLERAGVRTGMRCLDAGCGPGEVMRLLGRMVGAEGHVTGLDIDVAMGRRTVEALRREEGPRFDFVAGDVTRREAVGGGPFDLVFARLLLCHMTDPAGTVRHLAEQLRPGGTLVLMDYDMSHFSVRPEHPEVERGFQIVTECFRRSGKDADAGLRLGQYLTEAGLPPALGYEAQALLGSIATVGPMLDGVLGSLTQAALAQGIAGPEEVEAIRATVRRLTAAGAHTALGPIAVGAWTTRPG